jgi:outer membrane protein assembly factor BamB
VAYNAATGAQLWVQRYNGPGNGDDGAWSVAVSPGGGTVYVTGDSAGSYATVAYNAATGAQLWARRYTGPANSDGVVASSMAVSPGGPVFVTGYTSGGATGADYATIAYSG